ncbi:hypothetical protein D0Z07_7049 [Hyphodiscus hymeniophilus]|uniref:Uncharacterized protein n=1 Tax=Hyphodiscus hymeniophilus TaxID=353542 RepID=A0A9P6VFZ5_9HELO|nr:hypothetical protein D0Z07_7049 [Hyphodiscus hymeniophilus]
MATIRHHTTTQHTYCIQYGWVVFAVKSALSALAGNSLVPEADTKCLVTNGKSGFSRDNTGWVLGRILRDFNRWMDPHVRECIRSIIDQRWRIEQGKAESRSPGSGKDLTKPNRTGLCVAVYEAGPPLIGSSGRDTLYYASFGVSVIQLGIAAIPLAIFGDWSVFVITASGTMLSFTTCSLTQWRKEKWACRTGSEKKMLLTEGNGSQFAILILGCGRGLDLEDLCVGRGAQMTVRSQLQITILAALWITLLITATGIRQNTWYLFAVCAIGIFQNIYAALTWRKPEAYGIPQVFREVIGEVKVMDTLFKLEDRYPFVGRSMLDIFFPGQLRVDEKMRWEAFLDSAKERERALNSIDGIPSVIRRDK